MIHGFRLSDAILISGVEHKKIGGYTPLIGIVALRSVVLQEKPLSDFLDENHSHIILVDSSDQEDELHSWGSEAVLRSHFERLASKTRGIVDKRFLSVLNRLNLNWGTCDQPGQMPSCDDPKSGEDTGTEDRSAQEGDDRRIDDKMVAYTDHSTDFDEHPRLMVCFEGTLAALRTVAEAVRCETPVLLIAGSGHAADLVSECVRVYESELAGGEDPEYIVERIQTDSFHQRKLRRILLLKKFLILMREFRGLALAKGTRHEWPLRGSAGAADAAEGEGGFRPRGYELSQSLDDLAHAQEAASGGSPAQWARCRRVRGKWVTGQEIEGKWQEGPPLVVGSADHLIFAYQLGRALLVEFEVLPEDSRSACTVFAALAELDVCCTSQLCLAYDIDARVMRMGKPQPLDVQEHMMDCICRGMVIRSPRAHMHGKSGHRDNTLTKSHAHTGPRR